MLAKKIDEILGGSDLRLHRKSYTTMLLSLFLQMILKVHENSEIHLNEKMFNVSELRLFKELSSKSKFFPFWLLPSSGSP